VVVVDAVAVEMRRRRRRPRSSRCSSSRSSYAAAAAAHATGAVGRRRVFDAVAAAPEQRRGADERQTEADGQADDDADVLLVDAFGVAAARRVVRRFGAVGTAAAAAAAARRRPVRRRRATFGVTNRKTVNFSTSICPFACCCCIYCIPRAFIWKSLLDWISDHTGLTVLIDSTWDLSISVRSFWWRPQMAPQRKEQLTRSGGGERGQALRQRTGASARPGAQSNEVRRVGAQAVDQRAQSRTCHHRKMK